MKTTTSALLLLSSSTLSSAALLPRQANTTYPAGFVSSTTCNGQTYVYNQLAGYGFVPSDAYDKFGDTIGGIGSGMAIPRKSWSVNKNGVYEGTMYAIPDRGWNTEGTLNYQGRIHKFKITFTPVYNNTNLTAVSNNIELKYQDTILLTDPKGNPISGLDAAADGPYVQYKSLPGDPVLPSTNFTGDGFGGPGNGGTRVVGDNEGLVVAEDGTFWISDEYGPYIYQYGQAGKMKQAVMPPPAYIPMRNGSISFSADSPTFYSGLSDDVSPADPITGRDNNHGLEGLTMSTDGRYLYALLQAATVQDGGTSNSKDRYTRLLQYDTLQAPPAVVAEYVVPLPFYTYMTGKQRVAAQSEIKYIDGNQFLVLARDSNAGHGQANSTSVYRHADVFDISSATDVHPAYDAANATVAPGGTLAAGVVPATYCSWLDFNNNEQLSRFDLHNGGAQDAQLLNEKWESLALVPVNPDVTDGQYFLLSMSDNDFITQNGHLNGGKFNYSDASGFNLDSQLLAFRVTLPSGAAPGS